MRCWPLALGAEYSGLIPSRYSWRGAISCLTLPVYRWLRARMSRLKSSVCYAVGLSFCLILPFTIVTLLITPQAVSGIRRLSAWRASGWAISPELADYLDEVKLWISKIPGLNDWFDQIGENFDTYVNTGLKTLVSGGIGPCGRNHDRNLAVVSFCCPFDSWRNIRSRNSTHDITHHAVTGRFF